MQSRGNTYENHICQIKDYVVGTSESDVFVNHHIGNVQEKFELIFYIRNEPRVKFEIYKKSNIANILQSHRKQTN